MILVCRHPVQADMGRSRRDDELITSQKRLQEAETPDQVSIFWQSNLFIGLSPGSVLGRGVAWVPLAARESGIFRIRSEGICASREKDVEISKAANEEDDGDCCAGASGQAAADGLWSIGDETVETLE